MNYLKRNLQQKLLITLRSADVVNINKYKRGVTRPDRLP